MDGPGAIGLGVLVLLLIPIVAVDMKERRIPDVWTGALALGGLAYQMAREPHWTTLAVAPLKAAVVLIILGLGARLSARMQKAGRCHGVLGGGDAKLLAAGALWVGLEGAVAVLILSSLALAGMALADRTAGPARWSSPRPYAPAAGGALVFIAAFLELFR